MPSFILIDLDGTIIQERPRYNFCQDQNPEVIPFVKQAFLSWKEEGHFIAVCSNNVRAKSIMEEIEMLALVDFVVGKPSSSLKVNEFVECFQAYRSMYKSRKIDWKIRKSRIIFVDNDVENLEAIKYEYNVRCYKSVKELADALKE